MKEKISLIAVFVNLFLAVGKISVGVLSNSASVLAEGLHSGMDLVSSVISFFGIKESKKPADKQHPYGHYKFEVLTGFIITIILFLTGLFIIYDAYQSFFVCSDIKIGFLPLGVMLVSGIINEIMARIKMYYGKKENSLSLLSDGVHNRLDVFTSLAVFIGLIVTPYFSYADSVLAFLIGLYITKESLSLGREAAVSLLDVSAGEEIENKIKEIVRSGQIFLSEIKTQRRGPVISANLKIKLSSRLSVEEATIISEKLREELVKEIQNLKYVVIQIESHDFSSGFFKPFFGKGYCWQRKGRFKEVVEEAKGIGPDGYCVCKKCGYQIEHEKGVPCSSLKCPDCNTALSRDE